jgi:hypothetical protein
MFESEVLVAVDPAADEAGLIEQIAELERLKSAAAAGQARRTGAAVLRRADPPRDHAKPHARGGTTSADNGLLAESVVDAVRLYGGRVGWAAASRSDTARGKSGLHRAG